MTAGGAEPLAAQAARDPELVGTLTALVNEVYAAAERGLWRGSAERIASSEMARLIAAGEIAVVRHDGRIVGSVRVHDVAPGVGRFGLLVAAPDQRGAGIGRALVDFAEQRARARGLRTMELELLVPCEGTHPGKELLRDWYGRRGYRLVDVRSFADDHPHLAPLLATRCELEVHHKPLQGG